MFASVFYFYRPYDESKKKCENLKETVIMSVWKSVSEIFWAIVGPLVTLVLNGLVIHGVRNARRARRQRQSEHTEATSGARTAVKVSCSSAGTSVANCKLQPQQPQQPQRQPTKTATTAMLLTVSFVYVITTLPAALLFMVYHNFPEGPPDKTDDDIVVDPVWSRYFAFRRLEMIVYELSMAHYVVNLFIFLPAGPHFREAIVDFLKCRRSTKTAAI